ncbi:MAG: beta-galactosidase [bacterium]|nr:beta-galactosidase [Candidatus Colisoma equi]
MKDMKKTLFAAMAAVTMGAGAYQPAKSPLMTEWGGKVTPENAWREYPRPQMVRSSWTNLNGEWDYAITSVTNTPGRPEKWDGKILVPFALESALSGVGKTLEPDQFLWYTRKIKVEKRGEGGERILLHFGGVDFRTMVFIGHNEVTDVPHEGGQNPFALDITDYVTDGENELTVCVWDPTEDFVNSRGKQSFKPSGCFYTRVSGIWQTVWMERVPEKYIESYKVVTDIDKGDVKIEVKVKGEGEQRMEIAVFDPEGRKVAEATPSFTFTSRLHLGDKVALWSPENPKLYTFTAKYGKDEIKGYFGMRKFEKRKDAKGVLRFFLNNKPYFVLGTLDQGWWPDGLLTPPSEEAMASDIQTLKDCGFNTMRKHIKVEPMRYYSLCDKMGLLVVQDLPSGSGSWADPMKAGTVKRYGLQRQEMKEMMDNLQAVPSIVMWNPYNEGWTQPGEFLTHAMLDFTRRYDPTRLVNGPSGCWDWEGGHLLPKGWDWTNRVETTHKPSDVCEAADAVDMHLYRGPTMFAVNDRRVSFLGEFGGLGHPVEGHLWKESTGSWGYGGIEDTKTREGLEKTYLGLMDKLEDLAKQGLGGSVYTQTTDVEIEINGLMTYDRKVLKYDPKVLKAAHERIVTSARNAAEGR